MFPDCKWVVVGGSPCQDLTFAGPLRGVLGLIGPSSRLFFVLLCVIYALQRLLGPAAVMYLVENAASMLQIHLDSFCQLLGLPVDQHGRYMWDPWDFGFQITRKRNFFRNYDDVEDIEFPTLVFGQEFGPLMATVYLLRPCYELVKSFHTACCDLRGRSINRMLLFGITLTGTEGPIFGKHAG